ncbi:Protein XRI1 [Raphanus sativus]|uniref:Protein XRI1 isoform X2 n=1 Tax=Raphanus sativus TaxID=3726 RepID=A0A6J0KZ66_RAPSA|nr:protein XRI1 isoform X2 [Raphanus sativus]KAJ4877762.1 Protein XRI1 [Raphanus sativus]
MDYGEDGGSSWDWQMKNYDHQPQSTFPDDVIMTEVTLNQEDHSYMFDDESTPVKACTELGYHVTTDETIKKLEVQSETRSAVKRRRMLHFDDQQPMETSLFSSECFSSILKSSAREEAYGDLLPEGSQLIQGFSEDASASSLEGLDLYAEEWYTDCLNDPETPTLPDDLSLGSPEVQIDVSEYLNVPPETETREVRRPVTRSSPNVIFKGRKSFARPVPKLPSSIIYPFAFIKPCGVHGDMTLKDINQKIQTPAAKPKEDKSEPPVIQTSAFSGKPVVGKTKIRTEGGKGSITIMRTRG